jgi:hypothetical protein
VRKANGTYDRGDRPQRVDPPVSDEGNKHRHRAEDQDADRRLIRPDDLVDGLAGQHRPARRELEVHQDD